MKKLILLFVSVIFIAACSGKEEPKVSSTVQKNQATTIARAQQNFPSCTINGHDCWKIVQLIRLDNSSELAFLEIHIQEKQHLQMGGLSVVTLSDGTSLIIQDLPDTSAPGKEYATVTFPSLEDFTLNATGKIIRHTPAKDCVVNRVSCSKIVQKLNNFFREKPLLERSTEHQGKYFKKSCDEQNVCVTRFVVSDLDIFASSLNKHEQTGETYTYTLDDGRTVTFNWEPNDPEHGFLTVAETDGTQKKFDPQGNLVK